MEAFLVSTGIVALAEIGDKTQLLAFLLAARFKKPFVVCGAILSATLANHAFAGYLGSWLTVLLTPATLRWMLGVSFLLMAAWMLRPDRLDTTASEVRSGRRGAFVTTLMLFFLAEMGDKTQVATVAMAAHYGMPVLVVIGTTLGMLIADVPAVFVGDRLASRIPMKLVHSVAAAVFVLLGAATLLGAGANLGL